MPARDAMEFINDQDEATLERIIHRLELRGTDPTFCRYRDAYLERLALPGDAQVLEVGCGTGVVTRAVAGRPGFAGRVVGVDHSPVLIDAARRFAKTEGVEHRLEFEVADAHALDLPDGAFHAVIAHTLLSHVTDPLTVLREMARVVRPGGAVVVFDGDFASWTFGSPAPEVGQAMDDGLRAVMVSKPRVLREMPRLLRAVGLELTEAQAHVYAEVGTSVYFFNALETYGPLIVRAGLVTPEQFDAFLAERRQASADGLFFASCNYYAYVALRPERRIQAGPEMPST